MRGTRITAILAIFLLLSCAPAKRRKNGAVNGSPAKPVIVQAVGHDKEAIPRGAAVSSILNRIISNEMDRYDREQLNHVYERGVSGQTSSWTNPEQGSQYRVTPRPAYQISKKQVCRKAEIRAMMSVSSKVEKVDTIACRDMNGQWLVRQER